MKKSFSIILIILFLIGSFLAYKNMRQNVEYEVLNVEDIPVQVQNGILTNSETNGFSKHNYENDTYVFYKADHKENEYISTELLVDKKNGVYIITAVVDYASNDDLVSYEKVIKFEKVPEENIVLEEKDNRY